MATVPAAATSPANSSRIWVPDHVRRTVATVGGATHTSATSVGDPRSSTMAVTALTTSLIATLASVGPASEPPAPGGDHSRIECSEHEDDEHHHHAKVALKVLAVILERSTKKTNVELAKEEKKEDNAALPSDDAPFEKIETYIAKTLDTALENIASEKL